MLPEILQWMDAHLRAHGIKYLAGLLAAALFGSWATGFASKAFDGLVANVVVAQVSQQVTPIQQQVNDIEKKVDRTQADVRSLLKQSYMREVIEIQTLLCSTPGDRRLLQSLEDAQVKYSELNGGQRYSPPDCHILIKRL